MQRADQTVLSLRPGGGGGNRGGSRFLGHRFDSSSDLPVLRPLGGGASPSISLKTGDSWFENLERIQYVRDQVLQLREADHLPDAILKIKQEVDTEFFGEDQNWGRVENINQTSVTGVVGPCSCFASGEEKSWENIRDNREAIHDNSQEQLSSAY